MADRKETGLWPVSCLSISICSREQLAQCAGNLQKRSLFRNFRPLLEGFIVMCPPSLPLSQAEAKLAAAVAAFDDNASHMFADLSRVSESSEGLGREGEHE
jgi:hypothetical protein